jgi:excisionase family DNA binding protein
MKRLQALIRRTAHVPDQHSPRRGADRARQLLDLSHHQIYRLINRGELQSAKFGRARRITVASIQDYIKRHLEAA